MADKISESGIQEIEITGIKFSVDTDRLDDVDTLDYIERIESQGKVSAVLPLMKIVLGEKEFYRVRDEFIKKDAADHAARLKEEGKPVDKEYKGRMRIARLQDVYLAIIEKFDPKD